MQHNNAIAGKDTEDLVALSRYYGGDPDMIQAGGGNISLKIDGKIWVKASGIALKDVKGIEDYVVVDLNKIKSILADKTLLRLSNSELSVNVNKQLLSAMLDRVSQRPSIETFLHVLMKEKFVIHTHPVYVNAMTCSTDGCHIAAKLFDRTEYVWLPYRKPGYPLGRALYIALQEHYEKLNDDPRIVFLQNHGLIVSGESIEEIKSITERVITRISDYYGEHEDIRFNKGQFCEEQADIQKIVSKYLPATQTQTIMMWSCCSYVNLLSFDVQFMSFALRGALYPDHIVYCGEHSLVIEKDDSNEKVKDKLFKFIDTLGYVPKYIVTPEVGILIIGNNTKEINVREEMLRTHVKTVKLILRKSIPVFMADEECKYLAHWEAEKYRQKAISVDNFVQEF